MPVTLLLVHAASTCFLAGVTWVIQVLVYPGFRIVGPTEQWSSFHAAHTRRISLIVGPPWALQGLSLAGLLLTGTGSLPLLAVASVCALATVVLTVRGAVPLHERLANYDPATASALIRVSAWRTAAWTIGAVASVALLAGSGGLSAG